MTLHVLIRRLPSATVFAAIVLCFFFPFATYACEDEPGEGPRGTMKGIELATWSVPDFPPAQDQTAEEAAQGPSESAEFERSASIQALLAFLAAVAGVVSCALGRPRLALGSAVVGLLAIGWLGYLFASPFVVDVRYGYWLALGLLIGVTAWELGQLAYARRARAAAARAP